MDRSLELSFWPISVWLTSTRASGLGFVIPLGVLLEVVEDGELAVLEDEVELPVSLEDLDEVDQVGVLQLLQTPPLLVPSISAAREGCERED